MKIDKVIENGLKAKELSSWTVEDHEELCRRIENCEIRSTLIGDYLQYSHYIPPLFPQNARGMILDFIIRWYTLEKEKNQGVSDILNISHCRECLELCVLLQDETYLDEWLAYYKANKNQDYISKKKREAVICHVESYLDGTLRAQANLIIEECRSTIAKKKSYKFKVKDAKLLVLVYAKARFDRILLADKKTGEYWFKDDQNGIHYFNGAEFTKDPFGFSSPANQGDIFLHDSPLLNQWALWGGKQTIHLLLQFESKVVFFMSRYFPSQDDELVDDFVFCEVEDRNISNEIVEKIKSQFSAKNISDAYFDERRGAIFRYHYREKKIGVHHNHWFSLIKREEGEPHFMEDGERTYGFEIIRTFPSAKEARDAYEARELTLFRNDKPIHRIEVWTDLKKLSQFGQE